MTLFL
ncbi:unnamed protein product [Fusarium graminearum]